MLTTQQLPIRGSNQKWKGVVGLFFFSNFCIVQVGLFIFCSSLCRYVVWKSATKNALPKTNFEICNLHPFPSDRGARESQGTHYPLWKLIKINGSL